MKSKPRVSLVLCSFPKGRNFSGQIVWIGFGQGEKEICVIDILRAQGLIGVNVENVQKLTAGSWRCAVVLRDCNIPRPGDLRIHDVSSLHL